MSGAATFPCPWCGMSYPLKPVLIGKPVRCKGCRNAFVLQPEGIARKVEDPPPAAPAPAPAALAPTPPPVVASIDLDEKEKTPPPAAPAAPAKPTSERLARRKSEHLEAARAQMAAQLAQVATKAAESEGAKREERKSQRLAKAGPATGKPAGSGPAASRRIVLTGEGERQFAETMRWWIGLVVAVAVVLLLVVVLNLRSTVRRTLDDYAAPVPAERNRYPLLAETVRTRAWLAAAPSMPHGLPVAIDLDDADFAPERVIDTVPLREPLAVLKGLRFVADLGVWLAPADLAAARQAVGKRPAEEIPAALTEAGLRHRPHRAVFDALPGSDEDRAVLADLLAGTPSSGGEDFAKRLLDEGKWPDRLVLRPFAGRAGELLIDQGKPPYKRFSGSYGGTLLRVEGGDWPAGWRVLRLVPVAP